MEIPQEFAQATDAAEAALFERQQRELTRYQTRYVYLPFQDGSACSSMTGGYAPAGIIHPIPAPKAKCDVRMLPEGAQTLEVVSPSAGVTDTSARRRHKDPEMEALYAQIQQLRQMAQDSGRQAPNIAIYLLEVKPIVDNILGYYAREGAIEVTSLIGTPQTAFEQFKFNDLLFGVEGARPVTARAITARMEEVVRDARAQKGAGAQVLANVATEIARSVAVCDRFCKEWIRQRHLEMDDPQYDGPKRYSKRDLRALEFAEIPRRNEYIERQVEEQRQAAAAAARREERLIELMEKREEQSARVMADMAQIMANQTKVLEAVAANQGEGRSKK